MKISMLKSEVSAGSELRDAARDRQRVTLLLCVIDLSHVNAG